MWIIILPSQLKIIILEIIHTKYKASLTLYPIENKTLKYIKPAYK